MFKVLALTNYHLTERSRNVQEGEGIAAADPRRWPLLRVSVIDKYTVDAVLILESQLDITVIFCDCVNPLP